MAKNQSAGPTTEDRARTVEWLLLRRTNRAVTEAYATGVPAEDIAADLNMPPNMVRNWSISGVPNRSVLEILSERAIGEIEHQDAWNELVNLDWWEFEPAGPTAAESQLIGPVTEVPQAMLLGLLSIQEMKDLFQQIKPRKITGPVRRTPAVFREDVPQAVTRAARCLVAVRSRRAIWAAHLSGLAAEEIAARVGVPDNKIRTVIKSVTAKGIDPTGIEVEAAATVNAWKNSL